MHLGIYLAVLKEVEVEVNLRPIVGQSVLVSGTHLGLDQFFFLLEIFFRQLRLLFYSALSDERTGL
jgi:hypothetical protein